METLNPNGRIIALQSGANVVMPNVTTEKFSSKYEIYPDKSSLNDRDDAERIIKSIGRAVSKGYGFRSNS